ncbi:restriction endonuclease subunit S [Cellulosimicrobium sp. PMB13]|uniref:restriction endonuclease subunit S n=1 Tax=Cellulosimicrobium sp. PMB13 TaxID=3120158 RepID=UPI003F4B4549
MFNDLKPYPEYDDGAPVGWRRRRLRTVASLLVSNVDKLNHEGEQPVRLCNYVDVYKNAVVTADLDFMPATASSAEVERFRTRVGDVAITKDSESWTDIGVPAYVDYASDDLVYGYHLGVLRPRAEQLDGMYLYLSLTVPSVAAQLHAAAGGVTRFGLSHGDILGSSVPVPPLDEQAAIVTYLAHAHQRINRAIASKQRLIEAFSSQRSMVLETAVMGSELSGERWSHAWLGDLPAHWKAIRLKWIVAPITQGWSPQAHAQQAGPDEWGVVKAGCVNGGAFRPDQNKRLPPELEPRYDLEIRDGDFLVSRANTLPLVGSAALVRSPRGRLMLSDKIFRTRVDETKAVPEYVAAVFRTRSSRAQIESGATGASHSMQNVGQDTIRELLIPLPPIKEQREVVARIEAESARIDRQIDLALREIALLEEFRTRLTSDVVTGQVDVRGVAVALPPIDPAEAFAAPSNAPDTAVDDEELPVED